MREGSRRVFPFVICLPCLGGEAHGGIGSLPMVSHANGVIEPPKRPLLFVICRFAFVISTGGLL
jgi:hypothetical protein